MEKATMDEGLQEDATALQEVLTDLIRVYQFRDRDAVWCYDISVGQSHALDRLQRLGGMTLNDFAASLFLGKSSACRLADALERKGYMSRRPHPEDARRVLLDLTKRGRALSEKITQEMVEERAQILADLAPQERKAVVTALARLAEAATARVDTSSGGCVRV
jgi:MarR family 2-MHQ and catechol resistance regulon transcriptional repressor